MSEQDTLNGLRQVRDLVFTDPQQLPQLSKAVVDIVMSTTYLSVQQWGSQFFCDVLSPEAKQFPFAMKQDVAGMFLPCLLKLSEVTDVMVYKNVVLTATSMFDVVFDLVAKISNGALWADFTLLKGRILSNWNSPYPLTPKGDDTDKFRSVGARLAAIKFIGKVITIQTSNAAVVADPRRRGGGNGDENEICVGQISDAHMVLKRMQLEGEAHGLFDMLANYFNKEEFLVSEVACAVIENLVYLIQRRKQFAPKVFATIAAIDLDSKYQHASHSLLRYKLGRRFVERAIKNCLNYCMRAGLITAQVPEHNVFSKMVSTIDAKMVEQKRRGILTTLPHDKTRKKQKVDPSNPFARDTLTVDDNSYASLYQLIGDDDPMSTFDVTDIPTETLTNIAIAAINKTDTQTLITALSIVSARYATLVNAAPGGGGPAPAVKQEVKEEEALKNDDEDNKRILESEVNNGFEDDQFNIDATFVLPPPAKLSDEDKKRHLQLIINNFFKLSKMSSDDKSISSFNLHNESEDTSNRISQVAINDWGQNSWLVLLTRLATRGLGDADDKLSEQVREAIYQYFLEDIRDRIEIVIEWLNEEWYAEYTRNAQKKKKNDKTPVETPLYLSWAEKVLDSMIPFLEATDRKIFIRLISDLPYLNEPLVQRIKSLCIDPQRSTLGFQSLQFLIMFRPPVKQACLNILRDIYANNEDLKETSGALLKKYDPEFTPTTTET